MRKSESPQRYTQRNGHFIDAGALNEDVSHSCKPDSTQRNDFEFAQAGEAKSPASPYAAKFLSAFKNANSANQLDALAQCIWLGFSGGELSEAEAQTLSAQLEARRAQIKVEATPSRLKQPSPFRRSRFVPRRYQASPDRRASRERRRMLGGSSGLPNNLRCHYSEGQRAVLFVIGEECKRKGHCHLPIDKIAANAGVCRTTAQNAIGEARRIGHLSVEHRPIKGWKSRTNIIRIISREWLAWSKFEKVSSKLTGSNSLKISSPTKNKESFLPLLDLKNQICYERRKGYRDRLAFHGGSTDRH